MLSRVTHTIVSANRKDVHIMKKIQFTLTNHHIKLIKDLNFTNAYTSYDDEIIPQIDKKRPFGNSGVLYDAMSKLKFIDDEGEPINDKVTEYTRNILIELPIALEIMCKQHKFEPGTYEICPYSAHFAVQETKKWHNIEHNPYDLPDKQTVYLVKTKDGAIKTQSFHNKFPENIKAWKENN